MKKIITVATIILIAELILSILINFSTGFLTDVLEPYKLHLYRLTGLFFVLVVGLSIYLWRSEDKTMPAAASITQTAQDGGIIDRSGIKQSKDGNPIVEQKAVGKEALIENSPIQTGQSGTVHQTADNGQIKNSPIEIEKNL